jgi:L-fucose isomerase-like protein
MKPRVGLVVGYAPLEVGYEKAPQLLKESGKQLSKFPVEIVSVESPVYDLATGTQAADLFAKSGIDVLCWIAATWSYDHVPVDVVSKVNVPLIAWGMPGVETGSLCGSQQLISVLTELNHPRKFVFGELTDKRVCGEVLRFAQAAAVVNRLKKARMGMLGHRTIGMTEVTFHEYDIKKVFGPIVVYLSTDELLRRRDAIADDQALPLWQKVRQRAGRCKVPDADGIRSMKCYCAMKEWVDENGLAGVAVGCYPDLMGEVCLGCGLLAEEEVVTSCEGDMNSVILTYIMHHIGSAPVHNTDLLDVDEKQRTAVLSHCGNSAISLADGKDEVTLDSVRLMGQGVVSLYRARCGEVTMANLCGKKGTYRLTYATAQAVEAEIVFPGIPVKVELPCSTKSFLEQTADFGTGHHWMIAYGDMSEQLHYVCKMLGIEMLRIQ